MFITIDGPDGVGKTTVAALLATKLHAEGITTVSTTTPTGSALGRLVRSDVYANHDYARACLVAADHYAHDKGFVRPVLARGEVVICDGSMLAPLALESHGDVNWSFIRQLYVPITVPDIAFVLMCTPLTSQRRYNRSNRSDGSTPKTLDEATLEARRFKQMIDKLDSKIPRYPIRPYYIDKDSADQVADALLSIILDERRAG